MFHSSYTCLIAFLATDTQVSVGSRKHGARTNVEIYAALTIFSFKNAVLSSELRIAPSPSDCVLEVLSFITMFILLSPNGHIYTSVHTYNRAAFQKARTACLKHQREVRA